MSSPKPVQAADLDPLAQVPTLWVRTIEQEGQRVGRLVGLTRSTRSHPPMC